MAILIDWKCWQLPDCQKLYLHCLVFCYLFWRLFARCLLHSVLGKTRQGTSSQYQNSYLDLAVWYFVFVNSTKISSTNSETVTLSKLGPYSSKCFESLCCLNEILVLPAQKIISVLKWAFYLRWSTSTIVPPQPISWPINDDIKQNQT